MLAIVQRLTRKALWQASGTATGGVGRLKQLHMPACLRGSNRSGQTRPACAHDGQLLHVFVENLEAA
jgi:hypothetical protein